MATYTSSNLSTCRRQQVHGLLDIGDAGREVCAALEKGNLLAEVVHGGGGRSRSRSRSRRLWAVVIVVVVVVVVGR